MFVEHKIYFILFNIVLKFLIKSKIISFNKITNLILDYKQPIIYILPYKSIIDLLTLRIQCLQHNLPDPLLPLKINNISLSRFIFLYKKKNNFFFKDEKYFFLKIFNKYIKLHDLNHTLNIQIVPILVMFGRSPYKTIKKKYSKLQLKLIFNYIEKFLLVCWFGRSSFVFFSQPLSMRNIFIKQKNDKLIIFKINRILRIHFIRKQLIAAGPCLLNKHFLIKKIFLSKVIQNIFKKKSINKKISLKQTQKKIKKIIKEIAANFSYETFRFANLVFNWFCNQFYYEFYVNKIDRVLQLAENKHQIVYLPCHRSHMDYLLISYILYHYGLVPPHIAAGINLKFWPVGNILRRLGAFFIRRNFKNNSFYFLIFREYLNNLFTCGHSIEYFIEGGRSRTGKLLTPKTGILTMTIQAMLNNQKQLITLVPIYIGYDHVIEIPFYNEELLETNKNKYNFIQKIKKIQQFKLSKLGNIYINFGEPLSLASFLFQKNKKLPIFFKKNELNNSHKLTPIINKIATTIMIRINNAAAVNALNLCSSILLVQLSITKKKLLAQLACYLDLFRNVPYTQDITFPDLIPNDLFKYAMSMNKFNVIHDTCDEIIFISQKQAIFLTYYRNNIQHILVLPSLIMQLICIYPGILIKKLQKNICLIYPLLQAEFFMHYNKQELIIAIQKFIIEFSRQGLVKQKTFYLYPVKLQFDKINLLAGCISENLQRYTIIFSLLRINPKLTFFSLKQKSIIIAKKITLLYGINAPEFYNSTNFIKLNNILYTEIYLNYNKNETEKKINKIFNLLSKMINFQILNTIKKIAKILVKK